MAQVRPRTIPLPKMVKGANNNCYYEPRYSASKRLTFYPFSDSDSIVLVSFRYQRNKYVIQKNNVLVDSLIEAVTLNKQKVDQLTDILYNNFFIKTDNISTINECFFPRNAILFFKNKVLKESIGLCFHCSRYEVASGKYGLLGEECNQKLDMLKGFFMANRVNFGTDASIEIYPGETIVDEGLPPTSTK